MSQHKPLSNSPYGMNPDSGWPNTHPPQAPVSQQISEDLREMMRRANDNRNAHVFTGMQVRKLIERLSTAEAERDGLRAALQELVDEEVRTFGPLSYSTAMNKAKTALRRQDDGTIS